MTLVNTLYRVNKVLLLNQDVTLFVFILVDFIFQI